jgi:hypothetical protein
MMAALLGIRLSGSNCKSTKTLPTTTLTSSSSEVAVPVEMEEVEEEEEGNNTLKTIEGGGGLITPVNNIILLNKHKHTRSHDSGMFAKLKGLLGWQTLEVAENDNNSSLQDNSFSKDQKQSLWQMASGLIGTDPVSLISLPVWVFEPTTFLTRMAEPMFFAPQFFDKVANETDPILRLAHIAAFNLGVLCFTQRTWKPFNPVLGETFEFVNEQASFVAEQVSHHPPISAGETRSAKGDWICHQEVHVKTKLWGNYVEIYPIGNTHLYCPKTGDHYYWNQPK